MVGEKSLSGGAFVCHDCHKDDCGRGMQVESRANGKVEKNPSICARVC